MLRQPLETGLIEISGGKSRCIYPADFSLVAASNPCPCGFAGSQHPCRCTPHDLRRYQAKFSGPILDRIDLMLRIEAVEISQITTEKAESSAVIKKRIMAAVALQKKRYAGTSFRSNASLDSQVISSLCQIDAEARKMLDLMANYKKLSTRAYFKLFKVARTIADLSQKQVIQKEDVLEAFSFRDFFI